MRYVGRKKIDCFIDHGYLDSRMEIREGGAVMTAADICMIITERLFVRLDRCNSADYKRAMKDAIYTVLEAAGNERDNRGTESFAGEAETAIMCLNSELAHQREHCENPWYTEIWTEADLVAALEEVGVPVNDRNIYLLREKCSRIFDDKSTRNEMIIECARQMEIGL